MPGFGSILNLAYDPRENALLQDLTPFFRSNRKKTQSSGGTIIPDSAMLHPGYAGWARRRVGARLQGGPGLTETSE